MLLRCGWSLSASCSSLSWHRSKLHRPIRLKAMPENRSASFQPGALLPSGGAPTKKARRAGMRVMTSDL